MELRQLEYFLAVAEELHFRRAAERLHISQPPLSQQIKQLEAELGVRLFERSSRRVELTDPGRVFVAEARTVLAAVERSVKTVRRAAAGEVGWLRLGFVSSAVCDLLPLILPRFQADAPKVEVDLHEMTTAVQLAGLAEQRVDVGIARDVEASDGITAVPLRDEALVAVMPLSHHLADAPVLDVAALAGERFVMLPRDRIPRLYDQVVTLCRGAGFSPRTVQEATQFPTILSLVVAGVGVSIVPETVRGFRAVGVAYVPLTNPAAVSHIALVHRTDDPAPAVQRFVRSAVAAVTARDPAPHVDASSPLPPPACGQPR